MHTVWKGAISFGLVHVPIKMFSATEDKDISMRMIHKACGGPIAYTRQCKNCEVDVAWDDIAKGYEYEKGRFVLFEKEELEALTTDATRTIQILDFVDLTEIDPIYFQKTYYLSPDHAGANAYNLLLEAMKQSGKIGIAKISIRSKSSLAAIRVIDNCLAMETIFYPDEIRSTGQVPGLPEAVNVNEKELTMARMLIEQLSTPFEPEKYTDDYRTRLMDLIGKKIAGEEVHVAPEVQRANVVDLMAALQASLEAAKAAPGPKPAKPTRRKAKTAKETVG
ncbi:Ku protein [Paenibacillus tarimensis]